MVDTNGMVQRTFIREVPIERFTDKDLEYFTKQGYEIVWKDESVEIWCPASK